MVVVVVELSRFYNGGIAEMDHGAGMLKLFEIEDGSRKLPGCMVDLKWREGYFGLLATCSTFHLGPSFVY